MVSDNIPLRKIELFGNDLAEDKVPLKPPVRAVKAKTRSL